MALNMTCPYCQKGFSVVIPKKAAGSKKKTKSGGKSPVFQVTIGAKGADAGRRKEETQGECSRVAGAGDVSWFYLVFIDVELMTP